MKPLRLALMSALGKRGEIEGTDPRGAKVDPIGRSVNLDALEVGPVESKEDLDPSFA